MIAEVVDFAAAGVEELVVVFKETSPGPLAEAIQRFDDEVVRPAREQLGEAGAA